MLRVFKNKGEAGAIPLNAENLNYNFNEILNLVYPIGRGFIDFTDTDYSNYLGFTWERELVGMTAVGLDTTQTEFNEIGKTGGSKELQSHQHTLKVGWKNLDAGGSFPGYTSQASGAGVTTLTSENSGEGNSGNLQPYKVVSYWKRIL